MSFKSIFFLLFCLMIATGCGVKAKPLSPPEQAVSSYVESFTGTPLENPESDKENQAKKK